jgi:acyl-CoA reductase-like NAD-dependent aldehyde dehydrogenase
VYEWRARLIGVCAEQRCAALSQLYVSFSLWSSGFKDLLLFEVVKITVRPPSDFSNFMGPVMYVPFLCVELRAGH